MYNNNRGQIRKYEGKCEFGSINSDADAGCVCVYIISSAIMVAGIFQSISSLVRAYNLYNESFVLDRLADDAERASRYESEAARQDAYNRIEQEVHSLEYSDTSSSEIWIRTSQYDGDVSTADVNRLAIILDKEYNETLGSVEWSKMSAGLCCIPTGLAGTNVLLAKKYEKDKHKNDWKERIIKE